MSGRAVVATEPLRTSLWKSCNKHKKAVGGKYWWIGKVSCPKCKTAALPRKEGHEAD